MEMEEPTFEEILDTNRVEIVQRLQLDRTFLFDYLRSKHVLDREDCDLVYSEKTREQKAAKFLDVLVSKGEDGYHHFIDGVQLLNPSLYETITGEKATASKFSYSCVQYLTKAFDADLRLQNIGTLIRT